MTSKTIIALFFLSAVKAYAATATIEEAYKAAAQQTESIAIANSQLRGSEARVDEIRGAFLPELSAKGQIDYQNPAYTATGKNDQNNARLSVLQSLYAGGKDKARLDVAKSTRTAQEFNISASKNTLFADVAQSFYALMAAEKDVENLEKSVELIKARVGQLGKFKKMGKSKSTDLISATAQQSVLEAQLVAAVAARRVAKNNFTNITGLPRDTILVDELKMPENIGNLRSYIEAVEKRPDILGLKALNEAYDSSVDIASAGHLPSLDLTGNYFLTHNASQSGIDWNASLVLTVPLYSGGIIQAQVREAREQKIQADLILKRSRRDAEADIRTAYNTLVSAIEQTKALEKALTATEQNYLEQEKDYRFSLVTNLDVLQALTTFQDTKRTLDRTRYQAMSAYAQLKATTNQIEL